MGLALQLSQLLAESQGGPVLDRTHKQKRGIRQMFFDSRWTRIRSGLVFLSLLVMAIAGSAGGRWG